MFIVVDRFNTIHAVASTAEQIKWFEGYGTAPDGVSILGNKDDFTIAETSDKAAAIGMLFVAGHLVAPEHPEPEAGLASTKDAKLQSIRDKVKALIAAGCPITHAGQRLHISMEDGSRADLTAMATTAVAAAGGSLPWPGSYALGWIAIENIRIPLETPAAGLQLAAKVGEYYATIVQHGRTLKDAVVATPNLTALNAIDIAAGWP